MHARMQNHLQMYSDQWNTAVVKIITTLVFSAAKNGLKSVISIFYCSVSEGNMDYSCWEDRQVYFTKQQSGLRMNALTLYIYDFFYGFLLTFLSIRYLI